ncbi:MAG: FAD-dependent oxidoreductase, partial [Planctomycetes bacterium]|nr:FAD-dependent oxidoreductase [Planctomycetota bacterium]
MQKCVFAILVSLWLCPQPALSDEKSDGKGEGAREESFDVVVYGGTSGGAIAAVQVRRMGKSVVLIEPGRHIGGLTSGGLGATDIGNKAAIGGLSREFYRQIARHYAENDAWRWETPPLNPPLTKGGQGGVRRQQSGEDTMWTFEPRVAEAIYRRMLAEAKVPVVFGERLDLERGVRKDGGRIAAIVMESGRTFRGRVFIDATYEGDLLALGGARFTVGREDNATYGETLNGVQVKNAVHHQFVKPVDPYVKPGDPESGLLPGIEPGPPEPDGTGDHRVQAYCFRMCTTDVKENQADWVKP